MPRIYLAKKSQPNMSVAKQSSKNPMWKGDSVGYASLHEWVNNHKSKPYLCEICGQEPSVDLANISGEYRRDVSDWEYLCRRCHMVKDGRLARLRDMGIAQTILYTFNGESLSVKDWAQKTGLSLGMLRQRLEGGRWTVEDALTKKRCGNGRPRSAPSL